MTACKASFFTTGSRNNPGFLHTHTHKRLHSKCHPNHRYRAGRGHKKHSASKSANGSWASLPWVAFFARNAQTCTEPSTKVWAAKKEGPTNISNLDRSQNKRCSFLHPSAQNSTGRSGAPLFVCSGILFIDSKLIYNFECLSPYTPPALNEIALWCIVLSCPIAGMILQVPKPFMSVAGDKFHWNPLWSSNDRFR